MKRNKMILTPVEKLPDKDNNRMDFKDIIGTLEAFMCMKAKIVEVKLGKSDYMNLGVAGDCFRNSVKRYHYPIKVCMRNGGLYLIKKDI